jgi:hypothetical protein
LGGKPIHHYFQYKQVEIKMHRMMIRYGQRYLYHFTDSRNITKIKRLGGLFSYRELSNLRLNGVVYGGNDWSHDADNMSDVDDYVHLCFTTNHPMEYVARQEGRIQETCWICVHREVLLIEGVLFTNDVANKAGVTLLTNDDAVRELDHEAIFTFIDFGIGNNQQRKQIAEKYEILIPKHIPLQYLANI